MHSPESPQGMTPLEVANELMFLFNKEAERRPEETAKAIRHLDWIPEATYLPEALVQNLGGEQPFLDRLQEEENLQPRALLKSQRKAYRAILNLALATLQPNSLSGE